MNIRFNDSFTTEVQLKVKEKHNPSNFYNCSYKFSHFIYELQRSYFGPISEMCSIWHNLDPRSATYVKMVKNEKLKVKANN